MYGENAGQLRAELTVLLRQHRIQQRLGGPGSHTIPETTTTEERQRLGEQIARYRQAVLAWCHQAVYAAGPRIASKAPTTAAPARPRNCATASPQPSTPPTQPCPR